MERRPNDKPEVQKLTLQQIINGDPSSQVNGQQGLAGASEYVESVEPVVDSLLQTFKLLHKYTLPLPKELPKALADLKQKTQAMQEIVAARNELISMLSSENVELLKQLQALRSRKSTGVGRMSSNALKRARILKGHLSYLGSGSGETDPSGNEVQGVDRLDVELAVEFAHLTPTTANKCVQVERWSQTIFEEIQAREQRKQIDIKKLNEIISILGHETVSAEGLAQLGKRRPLGE